MSWLTALGVGAAVYTVARGRKAGTAGGNAAANFAQNPDKYGLDVAVVNAWESLIDGVLGVVNSLGNAEKMPLSEVYQIAREVVKENGFKTTPTFLTAIAYKESYHSPGFVFRTGRSRYEAHINDTSYGIMQTLLRTNAQFTASQAGIDTAFLRHRALQTLKKACIRGPHSGNGCAKRIREKMRHGIYGIITADLDPPKTKLHEPCNMRRMCNGKKQKLRRISDALFTHWPCRRFSRWLGAGRRY